MTEISSNALPPGWDCKYDPRTSRYYFINHLTKMTTWDDPRQKYRSNHVAAEYIPLQHGSPEFRRNSVYPSQTCPQQAFAFQMPKNVPIQDLSNVSRSSPSRKAQKKCETTTTIAVETEQSVSKIATMFPTVSDTHIRMLLKKYYNREAVVISALQVEKHPITTPGPFTTPPPPHRGVVRAGAAETTRQSPKPHSSPKMKLRYMKSIYPQVQEEVLLEVLNNNENNVQKASESLKQMGFEKQPQKIKSTSSNPANTPPPTIKKPDVEPKTLSPDEKNFAKQKLEAQNAKLPGKLLQLALESADFSVEKAQRILDVVLSQQNEDPKENKDKTKGENVQNDPSTSSSKPEKEQVTTTPLPPMKPLTVDSHSNSNSIGQKREGLKRYKLRETQKQQKEERENKHDFTTNAKNFRSSLLVSPSGHNKTLAKGSNNSILLMEYVPWDGPDPRNYMGHQSSLVLGPNATLHTGPLNGAMGPNVSLRKGPVYGLAKGSRYKNGQ